eukprot:Tamp_05226.p1 GENE.Tamp_05226~~Tamp_05226.p1  ORF type:complete len:736 (-),score=113.26 Tamp_05226:825-2843(-)
MGAQRACESRPECGFRLELSQTALGRMVRGHLALVLVVLACSCSPSDSFSAPAPVFQRSLHLARSARSTPHASRHAGGLAAGATSPARRILGRAPLLRMSAEDESLQRLVDLPGRRYILVGGKGGVGKTSTSAALAVKLADEGLKTLIISTDPAHSLGDALLTDLSSGRVTPISEQGDGSLYALEVDLVQAVAEFKRVIQGLKGSDADSISAKLGLGELTDLFDVAPPGADELVALSKIISLVEEGQAKTALGDTISFDRVVIDTAPTGHTLRLLEYPGFLAALLTKALSLRGKIDVPFDMVGQAGAFFAQQLGIGKMPSQSDVEAGGQKVSEEATKFRDRMEKMDELLHDPGRSEFVVVCIPTRLSAAGVAMRHLVVNQIVKSTDDTAAFLNRRRTEQKKVLEKLKSSLSQLRCTEVPLFDTEVVGYYGLRALGNVAFKQEVKDDGRYGNLFDPSSPGPQFVFVGGKGGVGKTSTSSSLAVRLADDNIKTLVISTDPAHSLGDCLDVKLSGKPTPIEGSNGNLYAMEVDTEAALERFKDKLRKLTSFNSRFGSLSEKLGLDEFADLLQSPPPGVDEVVALTEVMKVVKEGNFDRVIIDTAPTGHTLRLLSFPEFLDNFLKKVLSIKTKLDGVINAAKSLFGLKNFVSGDEVTPKFCLVEYGLSFGNLFWTF